MLFLKNTADLSQHRIEIFEGDEHLVIPVIAAVQGVLNGQFLPMSSLEASLPAWEGVAVTMSHPKKFGDDVSANTQFARENFVVGYFYGATIEDNKFKGEFWINLDKLGKHEDGETLLALVEEGSVIEVSTAYWCSIDNKSGIHDGTQYSGVQTSIVPNHIAILLHEVGACSVTDGCGAPRINRENTMAEPKKEDVEINCDKDREQSILAKLRNKFGGMVMNIFGHMIDNHQVSHNQIHRDLRELITMDERSDTFIFIVDVFDTQVVYGRELPSGEVDLFSRNYSVKNGDSPDFTIEIDEPVEVKQVVSFEPVSNSQEEEINMDREALIKRLATNEATPFTREQLTELDDDQLAHLATNLVEAKSEGKVSDSPEKGSGTEEPGSVSGDIQNTLTPEVAAALNELGAEGILQIQNSAQELAEEREASKKSLVSKLIANDRVTMDEATLRRMDLEALEGVARMAGITVNYAGVGGPVANQKESSGPPPPPNILLSDIEKQE